MPGSRTRTRSGSSSRTNTVVKYTLTTTASEKSGAFLLKKTPQPGIVINMTYLAVSIQASTVSQFEQRLLAAKTAGAQMLELRTDYLEHLDTQSVRHMVDFSRTLGLPVIVTCRDSAEGGVGNWPQDLRTAVLLEAIDAGAEYIDCEFANFRHTFVREPLCRALDAHCRTRLILSSHQFSGAFEDIGRLYETITAAMPAAIPKLIYTAKHISDCFAGWDLLCRRQGDAIVFAMGAAGQVSRILAKKFGSFLTFAALDDSQSTAPGQPTIQALKELYRWDILNRQTEVLGVIGDPVSHSLSPAIFNQCFARDGRNALYLHWLVQNDNAGFTVFMQEVLKRPEFDFRGFSVTMPHKANVLDYARSHGDYVEPLAETIGASNTIKIEHNGRICVYNTDYLGAINALTETMGILPHQLHQKKAAVLGAGGVSRAVVAGLVDAGARVTIYNRTLTRAKALADEFGCRAACLDATADIDADIVINCTSMGMTPDVDSTPMAAKQFRPDMMVFDTVYTPLQTRFLRQAQAAGCQTINGAEMFIRQAMAQYRIFTGQTPDQATIRTVVFSKLSV